VPMPAVAGSAPASTKADGDPFAYFVQAGAYARNDEAEQQRGRLAMLGVKAKVTEREQGGRTVYRVRVGPFDTRTEAEGVRDKLTVDGVESALVRVNK
jgi:cell division protein FtsN